VVSTIRTSPTHYFVHGRPFHEDRVAALLDFSPDPRNRTAAQRIRVKIIGVAKIEDMIGEQAATGSGR
jgi:hypothetical protein